MSRKFLVRKRLALSFLGEGWQECYIDYAPINPNELKAILEHPIDGSEDPTPEMALRNIERTEDMIYRAFRDGRGLTDEGVIELRAEDIRDLPMEVTTRLSTLIMGTVDPNSETPSTN